MKNKIERIKELDLPESKQIWDDVSYFGGTKKELSVITNILDFEIYENEKDFYLLIKLKNWYQKGPLDVSQTMIEKRLCYLWESEQWRIIELEVLRDKIGSNPPIWIAIDVKDKNTLKIDEV